MNIKSLIAQSIANAGTSKHFHPVEVTELEEAAADSVLSALSDAGLAVLPLEATKEMIDPGRLRFWCDADETDLNDGVRLAWRDMAAAFHPSQLETKDE